MSNHFESLATNLAHNIIELRQKRNLTQEALAKLIGLPRSTIANLESGEGNPSLVNLAKLSSSLHITIEQLLTPPRASCYLMKAADIPVRDLSQGSVRVFNLLPDSIPSMKIDRIELRPSAFMKGIPHKTGTKEYFHCVQGELTIQVFEERYQLKRGDVLAFPGEARHSYINDGKSVAVGISVVVIAPVMS